jgi:hypothetical protein
VSDGTKINSKTENISSLTKTKVSLVLKNVSVSKFCTLIFKFEFLYLKPSNHRWSSYETFSKFVRSRQPFFVVLIFHMNQTLQIFPKMCVCFFFFLNNTFVDFMLRKGNQSVRKYQTKFLVGLKSRSK